MNDLSFQLCAFRTPPFCTPCWQRDVIPGKTSDPLQGVQLHVKCRCVELGRGTVMSPLAISGPSCLASKQRKDPSGTEG